MRALASLSGRTVEPGKENPAKRARAREEGGNSARKVTSGPAATEAAPPSLTLLARMALAPAVFITRMTKSVAWPPACNPKLAPSRAIMDGALQGPWKVGPLRQVITPRP